MLRVAIQHRHLVDASNQNQKSNLLHVLLSSTVMKVGCILYVFTYELHRKRMDGLNLYKNVYFMLLKGYLHFIMLIWKL